MKTPKIKAEKVDISSLLTQEALSIYTNNVGELIYQFDVKDSNGNTIRDFAPAVFLGVRVPKEDIINGQPTDKHQKELAEMFNILVADGILIGGVVAPACLISCKENISPPTDDDYEADFGAFVLYSFSKRTLEEINKHLVDKGLISEGRSFAFQEGTLPG